MRKQRDPVNTVSWLALLFVIMMALFMGDPCSEWSTEEAMEMQCE